MKKFKLKQNFWFKGKGYQAGSIIELKESEIKDYRIQRRIDQDLLIPLDEDEGETEAETDSQEDREDKRQETSLNTLKDVKGIGDAYARQIKADFPYLGELLSADPETIAEEVPGIGESQARKLKKELKNMEEDLNGNERSG